MIAAIKRGRIAPKVHLLPLEEADRILGAAVISPTRFKGATPHVPPTRLALPDFAKDDRCK